MNKLKFFAGLGMLLAPLLIIFFVAVNIDWLQFLVGICVLSYIGVTFFLIANGAVSEED